MLSDNSWIADAVEALAGEANVVPETGSRAPRQKLPRAIDSSKPIPRTRAATPIQGATKAPTPKKPAHSDNLPLATTILNTSPGAQAATPLTGHTPFENHLGNASQPVPDQGQSTVDTHVPNALIGDIIEQHRFRWQMINSRMKLELGAIAFCRRLCDGEKDKAMKLWSEAKKDPTHPIQVWIAPSIAAMAPLEAAQQATEKRLAKLVKGLPVYDWAKGVSGLGDVSLSAIIGELANSPRAYKSVSAIWKRMGLAVINGGRQRLVTGAEALEHGYNPVRRSIMWNIGACLLKAQVRKDPDDEEKRIGIGPYGELYLEHKASIIPRNEAGEYAEQAAALVASAIKRGLKPNASNLEGKLSAGHIHNRAQRYIEKRLLRELWQVWGQANRV